MEERLFTIRGTLVAIEEELVVAVEEFVAIEEKEVIARAAKD